MIQYEGVEMEINFILIVTDEGYRLCTGEKHVCVNSGAMALIISLVLYSIPLRSNTRNLGRLGSNTETWGRGVVEDNILALDEDVTVDGEANARVGLQPTEAGRAAVRNWRVVEVAAWYNGVVAADTEGQAREGRGAREHVATVCRAIAGAADLPVVCTDDGGRGVDEGGAGVNDGVDAAGCEGA